MLPVTYRVLVRRLEEKGKTAKGGIIIPGPAKEKRRRAKDNAGAGKI